VELSYFLTECSRISESKGFDLEETDRQLLLMHSEISEAIEALRLKNTPNFWEEMADLFIRWASYCGHNCPQIEDVIRAKMDVNSTRPYMHGGKAF
jgi:NTP pyrophosphatase (non-canonical NTP hydrolase)